MATTAGETRNADTVGEMPDSTTLVLVTPPSSTAVTAVAVQTSSPPQESFPSSLFQQQEMTARNALFTSLSSRPFTPLSKPPLPQPAPAANLAGNGGRGVGGASTPNAGRGGGGPTGGGGGGPGLTNANQFMGANFGGSGTALATPANSTTTPNAPATPAATPAATTNAPATPTLPSATSNGPSTSAPPTEFQTSYSMTAPSQAGMNHSTPAAAHGGNPHGGADPLYVLDLNTGETVPANVTLNTFSTWSEDWLAQVSGATVSSYSWNLTNAPDLTSDSGTTTADLQGTWSNFTTGYHTDTISVTETPTVGSALTLTMTFDVAPSNSPGYSSSRPTSSSTWPSVMTPDTLTSGQPTQSAGPYATIGEADGSVQTSFAMPSYNPNTTPVSLDYSSTAANPQPIFLTEYQLPTASPVPSTITAQLTFNSTALTTLTYSMSGYNPGDYVQIALQANATSLSTGRYPWSITVTNGSTPTTYSGNVDIVNQANSSYGAGWSLDNVDQLVSVTGGEMLVNPDGTSLYFAGSSSFTTPAGDFSTLTLSSGVYTRTLTDGTKIEFNSSGQETSSVDRDGNTTTFSYNGSGLLTGITDMNSQTTTLAYNGSGLLTSITDPASRTATLTYSGSKLTSITDPASDVWQYGYDSSYDLTSLTDPNSHTTTFTYNFADRVSGVTQPDSTTLSLTAEQMNGMAAPGTGTSGSPATAVLLATGDEAQFTDANNNVWTTGFDWLGFGLDVADIDPLGDTSLTYRDTNGLPWLSADSLGRRTRDFFDSHGNTTESVAPDDTTQQYTYNSFAEVSQYTDQESNVTTYSYNSTGDLTNETDANSDVTTYAYNSAGLVTSTTDPNNHTTTSAYNTLNELTSTTDAATHTTTYAYDSAGDLTSTTDALGNVSTYSYDAMGRKTGATLPDTTGVTSTYTYAYDGVGNQTSVTDPNNHTTTYGYNAVNEQTSMTDPLGHQTTYAYDANGNQTSVTTPQGTTTYAYNAANQQTRMTNPLSQQTTYAHDAAGEQTSVTQPLGDATQYTYTVRGQMASASLFASGATTAYRQTFDVYTPDGDLASSAVVPGTASPPSYPTQWSLPVSGFTGSTLDLNGNWTLANESYSGGVYSWYFSNANIALQLQYTVSSGIGALNFTYGGANLVYYAYSGSLAGLPSVTFDYSSWSGRTAPGTPPATLTIYANGQTTEHGYNKVNEQTSVTSPLGQTTSYAYDAAGNQTSVTDPLSHTTSYSYNALNQQTQVTDANSNTTTYTYNAVGEVTAVTNPQSQTTSSSYDAQGRMLTSTDANGHTTTYSYDQAGNLTSLTDPDSNTTTYAYNSANQLTASTNPMGHQSTYAYNTAGLLTATTDADGRTIDYAYNSAGQKTSETWVSGSYTATYAYNSDGQLTSASDPFSTYTYTYNALGEMTSVSNSGTPGVPTVTLDYSYDGFGNRSSMTDSLGGSVTYSYDSNNNLTSLALSVTSTLDAKVTLAYDSQQRLMGLMDTGGSATITASYSYDSGNRLTNITYKDSSTTFANYTYGYNTANNLTSYQDNSSNSLTYGYDADGQLTSATGTLASQSYTYTYNYDHNGNRTSTSTDVGGTLTSATYSTGTGNELSSDGTYNYGYDNEGNMTSQTDIATSSVTYYTWDYENRLTEVKQETGGGTVLNDEKFTYDVNGNRIGVSLNGTQQLYTVYDGSNPYMDFNGSGTLTERYLTNPNSLNQFYGQASASGTTEWFLTDNINSIRQVISTSGSVLDAITYDPYGNIVSQTNSTNAPRMMFAGGAVNSLTGNYQFDARPYNPADGRFPTEDPLSVAAGDTNLYRYTGNSPIARIDPSGENWVDTLLSTAQVAGGLLLMTASVSVMASTGGVGAVVGIGMMAYGMDMVFAGAGGLTAGKKVRTSTGNTVAWVTGNESAGDYTDVVLPVFFGGYAAYGPRVISWLGAGSAGGPIAGKMFLQPNSTMLGVINNGVIVKVSGPFTSHAELASRAGVLIGPGQLAEGAEVFTVIKDTSGEITVWGSQNFGGTMSISNAAIQIVKNAFE